MPSSRNWQFRIDDILEAIAKIERYIRGMNFESWQKDEKTVDAVIRNLEVIGEAASHMPIEIQEQFRDAPWEMMKGIRNILAHEYFGVDLEIVWKTVKKRFAGFEETIAVNFSFNRFRKGPLHGSGVYFLTARSPHSLTPPGCDPAIFSDRINRIDRMKLSCPPAEESISAQRIYPFAVPSGNREQRK